MTSGILFGFEMLEKLPSESTRTGQFLRKILPGAFRSYHQQLGIEGIHLHDAIAVIAAIHPEFFTIESLYGDVETDGILTHGTTVFDRRRHPENRANMDVAVEINAEAVCDCLYAALAKAG